jgi:hypothetical protein
MKYVELATPGIRLSTKQPIIWKEPPESLFQNSRIGLDPCSISSTCLMKKNDDDDDEFEWLAFCTKAHHSTSPVPYLPTLGMANHTHVKSCMTMKQHLQIHIHGLITQQFVNSEDDNGAVNICYWN